MMDSVLASSVDYSMKDAQGRPPSGPKCQTDQSRVELCFCSCIILHLPCSILAHYSGVHDISTWELVGLLPFFCLSGLYELAMRLVTEHLPLETASILRKEWEHDTAYTYPLLFGMDHKDCHGSHLKVYAT